MPTAPLEVNGPSSRKNGTGEAHRDTKTLMRFPNTDSGNAERLAALYGDTIAYCEDEEIWRRYKSETNTWEKSSHDEIKALARKTMRHLRQEASKWRQRGERGMEDVQDYARKSENSAKLNNMVREARTLSELRLSSDDFDSDPWLLNTRNRVLNLRTGEPKPHCPEDYHTKVCNAKMASETTLLRWKNFLDTVFDGDRDLIKYVQRAVGYSLVGSTQEQCLFVLKGDGANGKSTFIEVLREVLGGYARHTPVKTLIPKSGDGPTPNLARLPGARFLSASELPRGEQLSEPILKRVTGGDTITARRLHSPPFEYEPSFTLFMATNHWPTVDPYDDAVWRRLSPIPFPVQIPRKDRDPNLKDDLLRERDGILRWAVKGAEQWQDKGLSDRPNVVHRVKDKWRTKLDRGIHGFVSHRLSQKSGSKIEVSEVYSRYEDYCDKHNVAALSKKKFNRQLRHHEGNAVYKERSTGGKLFWFGIEFVQPLF